MRRTLVSTKGFHAPRASGGAAGEARAAPPPPPPAPSAPPAPHVTAPARKSSGRKSATPTAKPSRGAAASAAAASAAAGCAPSGVASSLPAARGLLSGHFSANHLRRAATRRDEPPTPTHAGLRNDSGAGNAPHGGADTDACSSHSVPANSSTAAASAARVAHVAPSRLTKERQEGLDGQDGDSEVGLSGQLAARKRARSTSSSSTGSGADLSDTRHAHEAHAGDEGASLADRFLPRLPTARRLSTTHVPRRVFYPPSAEQPIAVAPPPAARDAVGGPAVASRQSAHGDAVRELPLDEAPSHLPPAAPLGLAAAVVVTQSGEGEGLGATHAGLVFQTPPTSPSVSPSAAATATGDGGASSPPPTPSHATRFLSALEHQRRDSGGSGGSHLPYSAALTASSASSTPFGMASYGGAGTGETCTPPGPPRALAVPTSSSLAAPATPIPLHGTPSMNIGLMAEAEVPPPPPPPPSSSTSREASLLRSTSGSRAPSPPPPPATASPRSDVGAAPSHEEPLQAAVDGVRAPHPASATTAAAAAEARVPHAAAVVAASLAEMAEEGEEEPEREESAAALAREMAEDLRLSTDVPFTPSATGSGAPPHFSQSSAMQEEAEGERGDAGEAEGGPGMARAPVFSSSRRGSGEVGTRVVFSDGSGYRTHRSTPSSSQQQPGSASSLLIAPSPHPPPLAAPPSGAAEAPGSSTELASSVVTAASVSAPATWPIRDPTPPRLGGVPIAGAGLLPLGPLASATGAVRHRTVFAFSSVRAAAPPHAEASSKEAAEDWAARAAATSAPTCNEAYAVAAESPTRMAMTAESPAAPTTPAAPPQSPPGIAAEAGHSAHSSSPPREAASVPSAAMLDEHHHVAEPVQPQPEPANAAAPPCDRIRSDMPPPPHVIAPMPPPPTAAALAALSARPAQAARPGRTCFTLHSSSPAPATAESMVPTGVTGEPLGTVGAVAGASSTWPVGAPDALSAHPAEHSAGAVDECRAALHQSGPAAYTAAAELVVPSAAQPPPLRPQALADSQHHSAVDTREEAPAIASGTAAVAHPSAPLVPLHSPLWPQDAPTLAAMSPTVTAVQPSADGMRATAQQVTAPGAGASPTTLPLEAMTHAAPEVAVATARLCRDGLEGKPPSEPSPAARPPPPPPPPPRADLFYDLPRDVGAFYASQRGVTRLYDWQDELLTRPEVRRGGSFIYSLPTSGGKTLVAELSLLRCVLNRGKSCFLVLPFVSLAEEKTAALQPLTSTFDFAVDGHYGSAGRFPLCEAPAIYVCTIEKANSLLNHMLEEGRTDEIGAAVVDELHMVGESRRGATLELFLSKLLMIDSARQLARQQQQAVAQREEEATGAAAAAAHRGGSSAGAEVVDWEAEWALAEAEAAAAAEEDAAQAHGGGTPPPLLAAHDTARPTAPDAGPLQIIGMSATVPNLGTLAEWLRAACFERDFRPVPLHAYSVVGGMVLRDGQHNERNLCGSTVTQHLLELATELPDASVLVFCASRQQCVDTAKGIVNYLKAHAIAGQQQQLPHQLPADGSHVTVMGVPIVGLAKGHAAAAAVAALPHAHASSPAIRSLLADLEALAHYEASQLSEVVPSGVAFHHGGLLAEERDLIETAFRRKHVRILCCTSTLAAGVNLPARRVIIKTPYVGREFLTKSRYLQMCGRAGRAGLDPYGESYLLLSRRDQSRGHALMHASVEPCCSQIFEDEQTLSRSLLECVGVGLVTDRVGATAWGDALLSRWAVGPVAPSWHAHMAAALSPTPVCTSATAGLLVGGTAGGAAVKELCAGEDCTAAAEALVATAENSDDSRSLPLPPPPLLSVDARFSLVPPAAMTAVLRLSLISLARCGLICVSQPAAATAAEGEGDGAIDGAQGTAAVGGKSTCAAPTAATDAEALLSVCFAGASTTSDCGAAAVPAVQLRATPFGSSSVRSCFNVEEALLLRDELEGLRHTGLILADDLHLCYFLTPLREVGECDWELLRLMMSRMSDSRQRIASLLGVDAYFIDQQAMGLGGPMQVTEEGRRRLFTAKRFYVALMLADVLAEVPMAIVEQRYGVNRGQLQNLMRSASMFSSSITSFCHAMEWYSLEAVLSSFVKRLGFGVKPDLLPLMEIRGMQPPRARALWNAGFKKLSLIAAADADDMVAKVKSMNPPDSKAAKFFTKRSALMAIREANLALQSQIQEKKGELQELTVRGGGGIATLRGVR